MQKRILTVLLSLTLLLGIIAIAYPDTPDRNNFTGRYPASPLSGLASPAICNICHVPAGIPSTNNYGTAYLNNGRDVAALQTIEGADSDGDGFNNITEIDAGTFPGDAASFPADTQAPTVNDFRIPADSTSLTVPITTFVATDTVGVTGYMVTESPNAPAAGAAGWSATIPTSFIFATEGQKTLYAWAKDAAGNVSTSRNQTVTITLPPPPPPDTQAPTVTNFTIPAASSSLTVPITTFVATDNVGVTGFMVTESAAAPAASAAGWTATAPATYTFATGRRKNPLCLGQGRSQQRLHRCQRANNRYPAALC